MGEHILSLPFMAGRPTVVAATHNGKFHADEMVSMFVIATAYSYFAGTDIDLELVRSRNASEWAKADVVVDVGGRYDVSNVRQLRLDHHQRGFAEVRPNGVPYAAAGLAWRHLGHAAILNYLTSDSVPALRGNEWAANGMLDRAHAEVDLQFIAPVDAADVGYELAGSYVGPVRPLTMSQMVECVNAPWFLNYSSREHADGVFGRLLHEVVVPMVAGAIVSVLASLSAERAVLEAYNNPDRDRKVLVLDKELPWDRTLLEVARDSELLYVVFPDGDGTWMVHCVPTEVGGFAHRKLLPESWRGLRSPDETEDGKPSLVDATGVDGARFCHPVGFIAGGDRKDVAVRMARLAVNA